MAENTSNFERLVSLISEEERQELLGKMRPYDGDHSNRFLEPVADPALTEADGIVLEETLKNESIFYRLLLWLRTVISGSAKEQLYNEDQVIKLFHKIEKSCPGLIDYTNGCLQGPFYNHLVELKKSAEFFSPYVDAICEDIGAYYVFLGSFIVPDVTVRMNNEADPNALPAEQTNSAGLRTSLLRSMDEILKEIPADKRAVLYSCARGIEWFRQFAKLPFDRLLHSFDAGENGEAVARFEMISSDLNALAKVMCNGQQLPDECFESIYLFSARRVIPHSKVKIEKQDEDEDEDVRIHNFMDNSNMHLNFMHTFITTVQLKYVCKVVFNNIQWTPDDFGGAEDWFVKYKEHWKKLFDEKWSSWLKAKRKQKMNEQMKVLFGLEEFPYLPERPWLNMWEGSVKFNCELTSGFIFWLVDRRCAAAMPVMKTLLLEGVFVNNDNRAEFANTLNELNQIPDEMNRIVADLSSMGQTGMIFEKLSGNHMRTLQAQAKIDSIMMTLEDNMQRIKNTFCNCSRSINNVLTGVLGGRNDTRYDGISNITTIQGNQNMEYRVKLEKVRDGFASALEILKELETIDLPGSAQ